MPMTYSSLICRVRRKGSVVNTVPDTNDCWIQTLKLKIIGEPSQPSGM